MIPKLTLEQFREIKNSMINLLEMYYTNKDESEKERLGREFSSLQDRLLSSDLSDIPFEEWQGLSLYVNGELDLSKTHANIDFSLLDDISYDTINIQGCNVKGIQAIDYDETTFDEEFIKANPEYFPDKSIPEDVRKKYYDKKLEFSDLIEYPALRRYVNENSFDKFSSSSNLVELIGFENAIRLFDENPVFVNAITEPGRSYSVFDSIKTNDNSSDKPKNYEEAKKVVYREVIDVVEKGRAHLPSLNDLPQEMIDSFPNIFIKEGELPDEVVKHYYEGGLSIREIKKYNEVLKTKDLKLGTANSDTIKGITEVFGNLGNFFEQVPEEYYDAVGSYLSSNAYYEEKISQIKKQELSDIISDSIRHYLIDFFRPRSSLYELYSFSKYVPIEEIIKDEKLRNFVQKCGFENLAEFNRESNRVLERPGKYNLSLLNRMLEYVSVIEDDDSQNLSAIFGKIIHEMRASGKDIDKDLLDNNKRELYSLCPSEFIDYNMLDTLLKDLNEEDKEQFVEQLEEGFNGDTSLLFDILIKNKFLLPVLENKNIIINYKRIKNIYQQIGNNKFLELSSKYGKVLEIIIDFTYNKVMLAADSLQKSGVNYEDIIYQIFNELFVNNKESSFDFGFLPQSFKIEHPEFTPNEFLNELDETIYQSIIEGRIKYDEKSIPSDFKKKYPYLFLDENVSREIKNKFYNKEFTLQDFKDNPNLIDIFDNTNIACAFPSNMAWIIPLFNNLESNKIANYNRLKVIIEYSKIDDFEFQNIFKEYVVKDGNNINSERIDLISEVLSKLSLSNSSEIFTFRKELTTQILNSKNPLDSLSKIEDIFVRNNIPTVGKVYSCFEILHPDFDDSDINTPMISPVLKNSSLMAKRITVFSDLIKCSFGSNNRSVNSYLNNIENGYSLYEGIKSGQIKFESLKESEIRELTTFRSHLATLYNNTMKAKIENDTFKSTDNVLTDILNLSKKTSSNGSLDYNLADRIIRMFCGYAGINTLAQAKDYIENKIKNADSRNRNASNYDMTLEQGDFIKGLLPGKNANETDLEACLRVLPKILQNGSVSKEYLGSDAGSDRTPLDTDVSIIMRNNGTISEKMDNTDAGLYYGPIWIVLKNDDRFITTRTSSETLEIKRDMSKMEVFYTGAMSDSHYGIRTGFASSEINYIVMENYDPRVGLEIAMNGFYIPVANKEGKIIFTPEEYDKLRTKMSGLSYYGLTEYNISNNLDAPGISDTKERLLANVEKTNGYNLRIRDTIKNALIESGVPMVIDGFSGNLSLGMSEIYSTGSTARNTNVPNDSDFDFLIKIDRDTYYNSGKLDEFKDKMKKILGFNDGFGGKICGEIVLDGEEQDVEISICPRTDKVDFSTDVSLSSKLDAIKEQYPEKYVDVLSNIVFAKEFFKNDKVNAYKSLKSDSTQGGLGGIGIENWILQNGGSFVDAAKDFVETADKAKSFEEFKKMYQVYDFGSNHYSDKKGIYAHDNFVGDENKMGKEGYERIHQALKEYLESLEISQNENNSKKR